MKVKDAYSHLAQYTGDELYSRACRLYKEESDSRIALRSHGTTPTRGTVESVVEEMKDWFRKVADGLAWESSETPENIIKWESSATYVRYKIVDPKIEDYGKRTRLEIFKGSRLPLLEALRPGDLDAISGMMLARLQRDATKYLELNEKREGFAKRLGKPLCPYGIEERFCPHQETYLMTKTLTTSVDDLVFVCTTDKCIKEAQ